MAKEHRRNLKQDYGIFIHQEIHSHKFVAGRGRVSNGVINKHTRSRIYFGLLRLVAQMPNVMVINVCLDCKGRADPQLDAWDRLLNRIERTMLEFEKRELPLRKNMLGRLPSDAIAADRQEMERRLLAYAPRALIFADEGRQEEITKAYRKMTVFNPIPSKHGSWSGVSAKNIPLERIIEDPVFKKSHQSFFIQLADCVAFALLKRETQPTPNIQQYGIHEFFAQALPGVCHKPASPSDPLGIVRK